MLRESQEALLSLRVIILSWEIIEITPLIAEFGDLFLKIYW
jgi:hypothetical protein